MSANTHFFAHQQAADDARVFEQHLLAAKLVTHTLAIALTLSAMTGSAVVAFAMTASFLAAMGSGVWWWLSRGVDEVEPRQLAPINH